MLIVNADDYGFSRNVTDAIVAAFEDGTVSSTTAMVWMRDLPRSAELARERRLPVGLHLNMTAPYESGDVPMRARERQLRAMTFFTPEGWQRGRRTGADPALLRDVIRDQLDRFRESFGEPTHLDGHHHVHVHPEILEVLSDEFPIRSVPRFPNQAGDPDDARDVLIRERFDAPDLTLEIHRLLPLEGAAAELLGRARDEVVELVTHPQQDAATLGSAAWRRVTTELSLGSYRDLPRRPHQGRPAPAPAERPVPAPDAPVPAHGAPVKTAAGGVIGAFRPCPICGSVLRTDYHERPDAVCGGCGALERQRALGWLLTELQPRHQPPRCLEIGPRNAEVFGGWLRARGWKYEAVDRWDLRGVADPDALGTYIDHDADLSDLHFAPTGSFDLFLLQHVLEEVLDYRSALDEITRILRPGGTAMLEIPWRPQQPRTTTKDPDRYGNVWSFGVDLLDELSARFDRVDIERMVEDRYSGDVFVCMRA